MLVVEAFPSDILRIKNTKIAFLKLKKAAGKDELPAKQDVEQNHGFSSNFLYLRKVIKAKR